MMRMVRKVHASCHLRVRWPALGHASLSINARLLNAAPLLKRFRAAFACWRNEHLPAALVVSFLWSSMQRMLNTDLVRGPL